MYEHRSAPLLPHRHFARRLVRHAGVAVGLVATFLGLGICGYHFIGGLRWVDALLDASMILSGMGPVNELHTDGAKVFAAAYALFSGCVFITSVGVVGAPIVHRFLHRFHVGDGATEARTKR